MTARPSSIPSRAVIQERKRTPRPLPRTPLALSVLNLANERPMHPYEMRTLMRERGHDRAFRLKEASLYDTVERLAARGFLEPVEIEREGRRPERTVYAITGAGRDELLVWLRELTGEPSSEYPPFAAPLMFVYALGRRGAIAELERRALRLEAEISKATSLHRSLLVRMPSFPRLFGIEEEYAQAMRRAELRWVQKTVVELRVGALPWPDLGALEGPLSKRARSARRRARPPEAP